MTRTMFVTATFVVAVAASAHAQGTKPPAQKVDSTKMKAAHPAPAQQGAPAKPVPNGNAKTTAPATKPVVPAAKAATPANRTVANPQAKPAVTTAKPAVPNGNAKTVTPATKPAMPNGNAKTVTPANKTTATPVPNAKTAAPNAKQQPAGVPPSRVPPSNVPPSKVPASKVPPNRVPVVTPGANAGVASTAKAGVTSGVAAQPNGAATTRGVVTPPGRTAEVAARPAGRDTSARARAKSNPDSAVSAPILRETFSYDVGGRRDPFMSLMKTSDLRPAVTDLRLTGILYDPTGRRPIAIMRDLQTKEQYRVTTGMMLGRMRVAQIKPHSVIFSIEEFGLNRQDSLVLGDSSKVRTP